MAFGKMFNAIAGNFNEQNSVDATREYQDYLIDGEKITNAFKLIRDGLLFTDLRIIFIDKQGATGRKVSYKTIFLSTIIDVEMQTAGSGLDDSELTVTYLKNAYLKERDHTVGSYKFEFPKRMDIAPLYRYLMNIAYQNRLDLNK